MTIIPGKNAILATDAGVGFDIFDFSTVDVAKNETSSPKNSVVPISGQGATCWSSFSEQTGNFYLTDIITSMVTEVNVDNNLNGTIVKVCFVQICSVSYLLTGFLSLFFCLAIPPDAWVCDD